MLSPVPVVCSDCLLSAVPVVCSDCLLSAVLVVVLVTVYYSLFIGSDCFLFSVLGRNY